MSTEPFDDLELGATLRGFASGQTLFGRFRLVRTIGRGGMGVVWLAQDEQLEREVALKFLPEMLVSDRTALEDLKRETRRSLSLTHHHIVRIFDFHQQGNVAGISMEYVDGDTLSNVRVEHGVRTFNPGQLGATVKQLCEALDYAHGRAKIVHRDLKPANLMVNRAGDLKVTDFGISASITESASRVSMRPSGGTLVYMSPQQLMGEEPCVADDVYSLGATLYDLITGKPPFYQGNIDLQVREKVPPPMAQRREALGNTGEPIPREWEETIAACLAKDATQRPRSAGELAERLSGTRQVIQPVPQAVLKGVATPVDVTPASVPEIPNPKVIGIPAPEYSQVPEVTRAPRDHGVLITVVMLALALVGGAGWWFGIEEPKRAETARVARAKADAEQRQREEDENARIAEEARKKKEANEAAEMERVRLTKEIADAEAKQKQMAAQAEADRLVKEKADAAEKERMRIAPVAPSTSSQERDVVLIQGISVTLSNRLVTLPAGTVLRYLATEGANVRVSWNNNVFFVPVAATNVKAASSAAVAPVGNVSGPAVATKEKPFVNSLGMKFVPVPIVGGPTNGKRALFGVWDVRVKDYRAFAEETKREWVKPSFAQNEEHPAVMVSWDDAKSFCAWLTKRDRDAGKLGVNEEYRLPSDHEWSCAVGIGDREDATASPKDKAGKIDDVFPWGTQWPPPKGAGNFADESGKKTHPTSTVIEGYDDGFSDASPVGSFAANQYGLYDMSGNVWQWCEDWYDGSRVARVLRGGSWYVSGVKSLRSSCRFILPPKSRDVIMGFRCVLVVSGG